MTDNSQDEDRTFHKLKGDVHTFIQYKGTDICMDLYCPVCGEHSHVDGYGAYAVQCPYCDALWEMPQNVFLKRVNVETFNQPWVRADE